ncbi:Uma2 family endonuclease [Streptomyces yaizuensis]|uniref:Uma2 family endonuclease n=1 Tax=Streptomyces yaizuensis TaxID=2989713 RepID=A0ABQ5P3U1_9ACTN|nr:Uma2 family endonuclease [Streptomyces sp. YSPA8]GLF97224.1 Uma2 family endonuclease [Streptomyces sp. YSPA8]
MTVVEDRIDMAGNTDASRLDRLFQQLEPIPDGYRVEIVRGAVFMSPQRNTHWQIIRRVVRALEDEFGMDVIALSDVRIDFPGHLNGFCPDVAKLRDGSKPDEDGRWRYEDVEFVAEVISESTGVNDYGPKRDAYAVAEVPAYLIIDPYTGRCLLSTNPKDGEYTMERRVDFGDPVDLTGTAVGLTLATDGFPRD